MKVKIFSLALFLGMVSAWAQENYGQWSSYRVITVNTTNSGGGANTTADMVKFPVLVRLTSAQADVFTGALANGADIRFSKADGTTPLKYQIERWNAGGQAAEIWVLMDSVKANNSTQTIRMYWGKAGSADSSKGAAVFETANGFQGVWHLGEATGASAMDATANAFHGTPGTTYATGGNPFDTAGVIGQAKSFRSSGGTSGSYFVMDGTASGSVTTAGSSNVLSFPVGGPFTVSAWVRVYNNTTSGMILSKGDTFWQLAKRTGGSQWECVSRTANSGSVSATGKSIDIGAGNVGVWKHVTATRNATGAAGVILYIDGVAASAGDASENALTVNTTYPFTIARDPYSTATRYLLGAVDEATTSTVVRPPDWVKLSYESQKTGATCVTLGATQTTLVAPAGLTYAVNPATYAVNAAIANNTPSSTGGAPTAYAVSPALPAGLALNTVTGVISGTPTVITAAANYTVTASNVTGSTTVNVNITISATIVAPSNLTYSTNPAIYALNAAITANNPSYAGGTPTGYAVSPGLPAGLVLNTATGSITGTPTSASAASFYVVTASNSAGSATVSVNITVLAPPSGLSYSLNPAAYVQNAVILPNTPTVTGSVTTFSVSPALPAGLSLNTANGVISGTPTTGTAAANYVVTATNAAGSTTVSLSIAVSVVNSIFANANFHRGSFALRAPGSVLIFEMPESGVDRIRLEIMNTRGQGVWTRLVQADGLRELDWNGTASNGQTIPSGIYLVRVTLLDTKQKAIGTMEKPLPYAP